LSDGDPDWNQVAKVADVTVHVGEGSLGMVCARTGGAPSHTSARRAPAATRARNADLSMLGKVGIFSSPMKLRVYKLTEMKMVATPSSDGLDDGKRPSNNAPA
jgi:hypothetical protein